MTVPKGVGEAVAVVFLLWVAVVIASYETVPTHTTDATHFDTLVVLGSPSDPDGKPSPEQRERVMEAVREFRTGRAGHIIVSGAAVHNEWCEAESMARVAEAAGVPIEDVIVESKAQNTIQNVFYAHRIMEQHGWKSAEVVSSPSHLPRASLILEHYGFGWRTQAAHWPPEYGAQRIAPYYMYEAMGTTVLRWFGFGENAFLPKKP